MSTNETVHPKQNEGYTTDVSKTLRKIDSGPSIPNSRPDAKDAPVHKQIPVDLIEEESMESFPASDPPGHHHNNTNKPEPTRPGQTVE